MGSRKRPFFAIVPTLWNIIPLEVRQALALWVFWKGVKTVLCQLAWDLQNGWLGALKVLPLLFNFKLFHFFLLGSHFTDVIFLYDFHVFSYKSF